MQEGVDILIRFSKFLCNKIFFHAKVIDKRNDLMIIFTHHQFVKHFVKIK